MRFCCCGLWRDLIDVRVGGFGGWRRGELLMLIFPVGGIVRRLGQAGGEAGVS